MFVVRATHSRIPSANALFKRTRVVMTICRWLQTRTPSAVSFSNVFKCRFIVVFTVARLRHGKRPSTIRVNLWLLRSARTHEVFSPPIRSPPSLSRSRYLVRLYKTIREISLWAILTRHYFGTFYATGTTLFSSKKKTRSRSSSPLHVANISSYELTGS